MNEKLNDALNEISDKHIAEAAQPLKQQKRRKLFRRLGVLAAAVAAVLLISILTNPLVTSVKAVSTAQYPKYQWQYRESVRQTAVALAEFWGDGMSQILSGSGSENQAFSPINLYMALCLTAELTDGNTQILGTLNADSLSVLRKQANEVWNACYLDDNNRTLLANSIWLDESLQYNQQVMDALADNYYTSVYQGSLGSSGTNRAIAAWLNSQTGNVLKQETGQISLPPETVLALYSTVYYQAKWTDDDEFHPANNAEDVFHGASGDRTVTYMNQKEMQKYYYWGEDFGAVSLNLKDGSRMWLILPDAGKTVDDVLEAGEYLNHVIPGTRPTQEDGGYADTHSKYVKVNLSLPKFDIRATGDLREDLEALGITDVFDPIESDMTHAVTGMENVWLTNVNQATRVAIDEKGVTAASYIELPGAGAAPPPEEIIDFVLDRPFLFVITNRYNLPLFAGVVNEP